MRYSMKRLFIFAAIGWALLAGCATTANENTKKEVKSPTTIEAEKQVFGKTANINSFGKTCANIVKSQWGKNKEEGIDCMQKYLNYFSDGSTYKHKLFYQIKLIGAKQSELPLEMQREFLAISSENGQLGKFFIKWIKAKL